jgi:hypothetical protein
MPTKIKGVTHILDVWNDVDTYEPIACLTSTSLNHSTNIIETETMCDPNQVDKTPGTKSSEISFEAVTIVTESGFNSYNAMKTIHDAQSLKTYRFRNIDGTNNEYGSGYLSELTLDGAAGNELSSFSGTIVVDKNGTSTTDPNA